MSRSLRHPLRAMLYSLLVFLLFVGTTEALLRLLGFEGKVDRESSWCREHAGVHPPFFPVMSLDSGSAPGQEVEYRAPAFSGHPRPFPAKKAPHQRRIFVVGSSAAHGYGFSRNGSFSGWLETLLAPLYPSLDIQVVNAGSIAWSSQQHLMLVKDVVRELEPDLIVVHAGNNELLEWWDWRQYLPPPVPRLFVASLSWNLRLSPFRSFLLLRSATQELFGRPWGSTAFSNEEALPWEDRAPLGEAEMRFAEAAFRHNLLRMIEESRLGGIPIVLSTLPTNWMDEPGQFPLAGALFDPLELQPYLDLAEQGLHGVRSDEEAVGVAEPHFKEAFRRWPQAIVHFRWGELYRRTGHPGLARTHLLEAIRLDENPHRAQPYINETIRAVAREEGLLLLDGEARTVALSPDGILGFEQVFDHCHATVQSHLAMAMGLAELLVGRMWGPEQDDAPERLAEAGAELLRELEGARVDPDRVESWLGTDLRGGRGDYPRDPEAFEIERWSLAVADARKGGSHAWNHAGVVAFHSFHSDCGPGERPCLQDAVDAFRRAIELDHGNCLAHSNLGRLLLQVGDRRRGEEAIRAALSCDPGDRANDRLLERSLARGAIVAKEDPSE